MYKHAKKLANTSVGIHRFISMDGTGDRVFAEPTVAKALIVGETKRVVSTTGEEVTSNTQLYIDGKYQVSVNDKVSYGGAEHGIAAISEYYIGESVDLRVVYL